MKNYLIILIIILLGILIYCFLELNSQSEMIKIQNAKIQTLSPKFNGEDTLSLLKLVLNLNEFGDGTKLLDTSNQIMILMYPYISKEYVLYKFNKEVWFRNVGDHPYQNQFMFPSFNLYNKDSARIWFVFNEFRGGFVNAKKTDGKWKILEYNIGKF